MTDFNDEEFDTVNAGASLTIPISAGEIKKGSHMLINGHPCKVSKIKNQTLNMNTNIALTIIK
jgi:hypothetical protein